MLTKLCVRLKRVFLKKVKPKPNLVVLVDQAVRDKLVADLEKEMQRIVVSAEDQVKKNNKYKRGY